MHPGQGPGLSLHDLGETGGSETVTLLESEIPAPMRMPAGASSQPTIWPIRTGADRDEPRAGNPCCRRLTHRTWLNGSGKSLPPAGGDQPHNNLQPYLTFYFCIALQGVFPPRG